MNRKIVLFFLSWSIILYILATLALRFIPNSPLLNDLDVDSYFKETAPYLVWVWGNFDGNHYLGIADRGYFTYEHAFFPFFPLLIRILSKTFHISYLVAGQIIVAIAFLSALFIIKKLLDMDGYKKLYNLFLLAIFIFPTSFFYKTVYNDSLFLFFSTLTIYFARRQRFVSASLSGFFATLTRLNGLALFFLIFIEYFSLSKKKLFSFKNIIKYKIYSSALIPMAFLGYLGFTQIRFKDWTLVFKSMQAWGQDKLTFPVQVFWRYFKIVFLYPTFKINYWIAILELSSVLLYIFLLINSYKRLRFSYWIFFAISILIPSLTGTFQGMPRYGLHLYPFFLSLTLFLDRRSLFLKIFYFIASFLLLAILLGLFARGYFVA